MWISKRVNNDDTKPLIQTGEVTLGTEGELEAAATSSSRGVACYSPMGYCYAMPAGMRVILADNNGEQASIGVLMEDKGLRTGEIRIGNQFGAYIYLKQDGSVEINGLVINREGEIVD